MTNRAPTVVLHKGHRVIDRNDMANIGVMREGKLVSVDRGQFGECQAIILDMLAEVYETDPVAVMDTLEMVLHEKYEQRRSVRLETRVKGNDVR